MIFNPYLLWALLAAALVPLALIATRTELRKVRRAVIRDLQELVFKNLKLPQLTAVEARYCEHRNKDANLRAGGRQAEVRIWTGAAIYFAVCFAGFATLIAPSQWLLSAAPDFPSLTYALLWSEQQANQAPQALAYVVTIAAVAFLGGYVFQLRYLIRITLNQELSALAFVRASLHIVQGMIVALIAFRVVGQSSSVGFAASIGVAFLIGYWPDLGIARIAKLVGVHTKYVDEDALAKARIIPLEVIDGIDVETAFRLQESNLNDVQNLATANPIQLYVETPFGLLQIFDWVLQAQLCENTGPATFFDLRSIGIRTVFDLERAALACGAPAEYVTALGVILFAHANEPFAQRFALPPAPGGAAPTITPEIVRHAVAIILDDLHIHQLRALWRVMLKETQGTGSSWLHPTGPLPGEPDLPKCPV